MDAQDEPTRLQKLSHKIDTYFRISERGSTIGTEIRAGTAAFLTMSYLLLVNPQIMAQAGIAHSDGVLATALSSGISTLVVGIFGNIPFGLAPGLGLSAYLSYGLVLAGLADLKDSMTACMASGVLLAVCAFSGLTDIIMRYVPRSVKFAIVVGMGLLIAMIGMVSVELIITNPDTLVALGDLSSWRLEVCLAGVVLVGTLVYHEIKGGILIGIAVLTILFWQINSTIPPTIAEVPSLEGNISDLIDIRVLFDWSKAAAIYPAIGAFLFICIFDVSGVMFGLATLSELIEEDGTIPRSIWTFIGSSVGTLVAAATGSTPIIITVECAAGIKEGGRTGLTAVTIGLYFIISIFFAPLFGAVPAEATAPVLILVGVMMMGESKKIEWERMDDAIPAFLTIIMMPLTYSITNGMVFGLVTAAVFYVTTGAAFQEVRQVCSKREALEDDKEEILMEGENLTSKLVLVNANEADNTNYGTIEC